MVDSQMRQWVVESVLVGAKVLWDIFLKVETPLTILKLLRGVQTMSLPLSILLLPNLWTTGSKLLLWVGIEGEKDMKVVLRFFSTRLTTSTLKRWWGRISASLINGPPITWFVELMALIFHMLIADECCNTCGDIGVAEAIVTCPQCKEIHEHMYCMRIYTEEYPIDWYCTECEPTAEPVSTTSCPWGDLPRESRLINFGIVCQDGIRSSKSRKLSKETRRGSVDWEKKVVTGRAKYIPVKEAIKLSSGAHNTLSPTKVTCHSSPPQLMTGVNLLGRTSIKPQTVPMKFSACQDRAKFASGPSQKLKPKRHGNVEISRRQQQSKELRVQRPLNDIQAAPTHIDEHIQKKRTADVINATKKLSYAPSVSHPVIISGSDGCPDVEPGTSNAENINNGILPDVESRTSNAANMNNSILLDVEPRTTNSVNVNNSILPYVEPRTSNAANVNNNILLDIEPRTSTADNVNNSILPYEYKNSSNPARNAVWMGSFSILNGFKHRTLIDRIQAHPPGIVRRKAYEFSKLMPEVLHFELFQCRELWMNLLQEHHPDGKNIGLYFLPRDSERSEDYFSLLESMIKKDLALKKQIGDVELPLFASTRLSPDCQRWNRKYFIWGLFHREKRHDIACQDRALNLFVRPSFDAHDSFDGDNNEVVDMEIDMIGGENVGPTDIVVRREEHGGSSKESTATAALHRNLESLKRGPALDVKREQ